ncbi:alpha/beta fold hydrolase [Sandaracinus amylolyticus]|nr:alpha/beta fold hydrolase [Sandaracinus amylolyticus]
MPHRFMQLSDRFLVGQLQLRGFTSRRVRTSAGHVHVLEAAGRGSLPPLLVLHGFSAAGHLYDGVMLRMRPHARRIVAPDMLGHGLSDMPAAGLCESACRSALLETIDRIVDEPCIVFGNSLGGAAALTLAIDRPEKVRGLFLVAPGGAPMDAAELGAFVDRFRLRTHDEALDFVDRLFAKPHPMRQVLAWGTRKQFGRPGLRDLLERVKPEDLLCPRELGRLRMPIQVVWGAADRILHPTHLDFFRRHLPAHAKLQVVEHYGHTPHMDHPEELHRRLLAFARLVHARTPQREVVTSPGVELSASAERPELPGISASVAP